MSNDFRVDHLSDEQKTVAQVILEAADAESGGGCRAFYTPEEWADRHEEYGLESLLIVVHDGGELAPALNPDYECYDLHDRVWKALDDAGYMPEACTCWYTAIYRKDGV